MRNAQRDNQRLIDIFEATNDVVGIADPDGQTLYLNASARRFFGLPEVGLGIVAGDGVDELLLEGAEVRLLDRARGDRRGGAARAARLRALGARLPRRPSVVASGRCARLGHDRRIAAGLVDPDSGSRFVQSRK